MDPKKIIHAKPCKDCLLQIANVGAIDPLKLDHADCQMVVNQALRVTATHPDFSFALIAGDR